MKLQCVTEREQTKYKVCVAGTQHMLVSVFAFYIIQSPWGKHEADVDGEWATRDGAPSC